MNRMLKFLIFATIASTLALIYHPCYAQAQSKQSEWPTKPIRLVVGFAPGGGADVTARLLAARLGVALGQPVLVENKPGAGSTLAAAAVAQAAPDGHTLLLGSNTAMSIAPHVYDKLPYRPRSDFVPTALFARVPQVLVVHPSVPARDVTGLDELLRKGEGSFSYGSFGSGTSSHLAMETFRQAAGAEMTHVPYKGSAPMLNDLLGGQIPMAIDLIQSIQAHVQAGKLRPLAITSAERSPLAPDVPTFRELGYPSLVLTAWFGVMAPAGTPDAVVERLASEIGQAVQAPEVRAQFAKLGIEPMHLAGPEAAGFLEKDHLVWGEAARISNARLD